jgi:membrane protease YdiL (CAAX protease family)
MFPFLALALLLTWPLQIPVFLGITPPAAELPLLALAGLGPSLAAVILTRGRVFRELRKAPRLAPAVVALLGPSALVLVAVLLGAALGGRGPMLMLPFWGAVIWPPFGEELGWRGYLYPSLSERFGPLLAAFATGGAWALWHLPTVIGSSPAMGAMFLFGIVVISLPMAWIHERGGGNVWIAILAHAGINGVVLVRELSVPAMALRTGVFLLAALLAARALQSPRSLGRISE